MRIGFDAKRAFFNRSGLGNYSRDTISILSEYFSMNEYVLYTPKPDKSIPFNKSRNISISGPTGFWTKKFPSYWRTYKMAEQLIQEKIQLFHGLSNELPVGIENTQIPSVVTIHDIIFMRYPQFYTSVDRNIYIKKFKHAASQASRIISVSQQTKEDLIEFFKVKENKIDVIYQGCNPIFWNSISETDRLETLMKYNIPKEYILCVGTIEERKNILKVIKAIHKSKIRIPLVIIGKPTPYLSKVQAFVEYNRMDNVIFLHNVPTEDLPAFYQNAKIFVYPSLFEGFGIPILEALTSKTPVITSRGGCFAEAGGKSSIYIDPENIDELADTISQILNSATLRDNMIIDGFVHAQQFRQDKIASNIMGVYEKLV
jgi:glycosyltransferase involved in cell wall biosynthesis